MDAGKQNRLGGRTLAGEIEQTGEHFRPAVTRKSSVNTKTARIQADLQALDRAVGVLKDCSFANSGPDAVRLGLGIEILLRRESERAQVELRQGKSLAHLFPDEEVSK